MNVLIEKTGTIPNICFTSWDAMHALFIANERVRTTDIGTTVIIGKDPPSAAQIDNLWYKLSGDDLSPVGLYKNYNGSWISPHPEEPFSQVRRMFVGTSEELKSYDGGDGGDYDTVGNVTGPMWAIDTDFAGKFPIAPGTMESTLEIAVGDTGGTEKVALTEEEGPSHKHPIGLDGTGIADDSEEVGYIRNDISFNEFADENTVGYTRLAGGDSEEIGSPTVAHNNLPPYRGIYIIKRTARRFYKGS